MATHSDFFSEDDDFEVPLYATLAANNIFNPVELAANCVKRGLIHPPDPSKTKARPPNGKKAHPYLGENYRPPKKLTNPVLQFLARVAAD